MTKQADSANLGESDRLANLKLWKELIDMILAWEDSGESPDDLACAIISKYRLAEIESLRSQLRAVSWAAR